IDAAVFAALDALDERLLDQAHEAVVPLTKAAAPRPEAPLVAVEEHEERALVPEEREDLAREPLETPRRRGLLGQRRRENRIQPVEPVEDRREIEVFLGPEIPVDGALADPPDLSDVVDQNFVEVSLREDFGSGVEDLLELF